MTTGAVIIAMIVVVLTVLLLVLRRMAGDENEEQEEAKARERISSAELEKGMSCCGAHEVCEAESLLTMTDKIVYYEDEELDRYRGRASSEYEDEEIDEFRDVLLTLKSHEVAGWLVSLGLRGIEPPAAIREEALMIVTDFRESRKKK